MITLKQILVPTDLSEYSAVAIDYAESIGFRYGAGISLLHVAEPAAPAPPGRIAGTENRPGGHRTETEALAALRSFMERSVPREVTLRPVIRFGIPAEEIRRFAEDERIDLIIMATHGRTGLGHLLLGSVAERVVRLTGVPVLTVKPASLREAIIRPEDIEHDLHLR